MSKQIEIAKTVAEQIGNRRLWALGAKNKIAISERGTVVGGLQFSASLYGKKNCKVIVELTGMDTYNVLLLKPRAYVVLGKATDIHCEELGELVESMVEHFFKN